MDLRQTFFKIRRNHLFITTCIENKCARPLMFAFVDLSGRPQT